MLLRSFVVVKMVKAHTPGYMPLFLTCELFVFVVVVVMVVVFPGGDAATDEAGSHCAHCACFDPTGGGVHLSVSFVGLVVIDLGRRLECGVCQRFFF